MGRDPILHRVVDRRAALLGIGIGTVGALTLAGCTGGSDDARTATSSRAGSGSPTTGGGAAVPACTLVPEETEGPFVLDLSDQEQLFRRDITEGRPGVPLAVTLTVLGVGGRCAPLADARVDLWQTDAAGVYSGFAQDGADTVGETFMRGIQRTDASGRVTFDTVYPGWYPGRVTHIHYQVFVGDGLVATSQLAFPDEVTQTVYDSARYRDRGQNDSVPTVADDGIFADGVDGQMLVIAGGVSDGYQGTLTVGVQT